MYFVRSMWSFYNGNCTLQNSRLSKAVEELEAKHPDMMNAKQRWVTAVMITEKKTLREHKKELEQKEETIQEYRKELKVNSVLS